MKKNNNNLRFYILLGLTLLGLFYIFFIYKGKYLGIYEKEINIDYTALAEDGYVWEYSISNDNIIELQESNDNTWKFIAKRNGKTKLEYIYYSSDKVDRKYIITYELLVEDDTIYWTKGEGKGLIDFPNPY